MFSTFITNRYFVDIGAIPFHDFSTREFGNCDNTISSRQQTRNQKIINYTKASSEIFRYRTDVRVVHDYDLIPSEQRTNNA